MQGNHFGVARIIRIAMAPAASEARQDSDPPATSGLRSRQSPFRPGVELQEGLLKPRGIGMGIELRRIDGGVSKQFLNHAEVGAMRQ